MKLEHKYHNLSSVDRSGFGSKPNLKGRTWDPHTDVNFYISDLLVVMPLPSSQNLRLRATEDSSGVKNELGTETMATCYSQGTAKEGRNGKRLNVPCHHETFPYVQTLTFLIKSAAGLLCPHVEA